MKYRILIRIQKYFAPYLPVMTVLKKSDDIYQTATCFRLYFSNKSYLIFWRHSYKLYYVKIYERIWKKYAVISARTD